MLQQIISHTPAYVWAILGFLAYRGVAASRDRVVTYRSLFVMPAVMLGLAYMSVAGRFGDSDLPAIAWLVMMAAGAALGWSMSRKQVIGVDRAAETLQLRGSWAPLALMMAVFVCKYVVGVALATQPALAGNQGFAMAACAVFGLFNGVFNGRLLRCMAAWHAAAAPVARAA
jgi:hypothetical protein